MSKLMCWKYFFDTVAVESAVEAEPAVSGPVSPGFGLAWLSASVSAGKGIRLVSIRNPFLLSRPLSVSALASTAMPSL